MNRALIYLFLLLVLIMGTVLTSLNAGVVSFQFYFGAVELPLALLLFCALLLGIVLGIAVTLGVSLTLYREKRQLRRSLKLQQQEIRNLRDIPIKGRH